MAPVVPLCLSLIVALASATPLLAPASPEGWNPAPVETPTSVRPAGAPSFGEYIWPVRGPVIRPFQAPSSHYGPGHRGIDIGVPLGTAVSGSGGGTVAFAGFVAGSLFVSIDHPDGVRTTYSWLSEVRVARGDPVEAGTVIGSTGHGHTDVPEPHLHFGALVGGTYIDPMLLLGGGSVVGLIRLAPLHEDR